MYICDTYQPSLKFYCQRFSNNANPIFTDEELLTVYLFCGACQRAILQHQRDTYAFMVPKPTFLSDIQLIG